MSDTMADINNNALEMQPMNRVMRSYAPHQDIEGDIYGATVILQNISPLGDKGLIVRLKYSRSYDEDLHDVVFQVDCRENMLAPWVTIITADDVPEDVLRALIPSEITVQTMVAALNGAYSYINKTYFS